MFAKFYSPPDGTRKLRELFKFATKDISSYDYQQRFIAPGEFTMELPVSKELVGNIRLGYIIEIDGDWLIIETVAYNNDILTLSGSDLKGILSYRISAVGSSEDMYDVFPTSGTANTAQCIEYYINRNIISADDVPRRMPLSFSAGTVQGLYSDGYMAKLENLADIVKTLCYTAGIGYTIAGKSDSQKLEMKLLKGTDRSMDQNVRPRVILSPGWGNVREQSFEHDISNMYNAITAQKPDGTLRVVNRGGSAAEGLVRRECTVEVGSNEDADADRLALEAVEDNTDMHTYKAVPLADSFGADFEIGDIISVRDRFTGNCFSAPVTEVHKSYSSGSKTVDITVGGLKPKLLNRIINNLLSGTQKRR